jgi:ribosomal protein S18
MDGIHGVHAMKKEELIAAIRKAKGLSEEGGKKPKGPARKKEKKVYTIAELKQKVKELRAKKEEALQQQNWKTVEILKKRISHYKKRTRRIAA